MVYVIIESQDFDMYSLSISFSIVTDQIEMFFKDKFIFYKISASLRYF